MIELTPSTPRKSLNKAYLKVKPSRTQIEQFKKNLIGLLDGLDESESEEHVKNDLGNFLRNTFYQSKFYINTKDRTDLVIHNGPDAKSFAGVLIEAKKPSNKSEMIRQDSLNAKAFHELILYYLRERITNHNLEIKHLVATNIYEWFVFDASLFEKIFAQDKKLIQQFTDFEEGRLAGKTTDFFYGEIAAPFLSALTTEIYFTWFDFREYDNPLRNDDRKDDSKLIALYKLLTPEHLLKLPFANDSNSLDKAFYSELLHIIGLTETKEGSKKLIGRKKEGERNSGSLIESAIIQLDNLDKISRLDKPAHFGETVQERLFNVALELSITWINRILFLKLLEAQLLSYHKGDPAFAFLNCEKVQNFDDLNTLFFGVLARIPADRNEGVRKLYANVPYLNSSLFEPTLLEHSCLFISQLKDDKLPIISSTVLKDNTGKKFHGALLTLEYLFKFLDAYDFAGEGSEEIQEENKTLINASVLGLIFEKINGYKDGSFFTPGFITMYMCRETIRRAVVQKFNDIKGWNCSELEELYDKIEDRKEANDLINSLKICDPAVGSGHFLVSSLNEIIAIKSELKILSDKEGKRLKEYYVEVVNDELIITDEDGDLFEYNPKSPESQRVQMALFHEKQTIIENCLFGVDINPNSVKICRLRLWIELLKNAYYKESQSHRVTESQSEKITISPSHHFTISPFDLELETLPNIDINIKCGNSLISRYALDADIKQALKKGKWSIESYRLAVMTYRNAENKDQKREMTSLINKIKNDFQTEIGRNDPRIRRLDKLANDLYHRFTGNFLFEPENEYGDEKLKAKRKVEQKKIEDEISRLTKKVEEIKENRIYENAFEWRFEFPEVLNNEGDFVGFDVVIGNPPYIGGREWKLSKSEFDYYTTHFTVAEYQFDAYILFWEKSCLLSNSFICLITPNTWLNNQKNKLVRQLLLSKQILQIVDYSKVKVFEDATVLPIITLLQKNENETITEQTKVFTPQDNDFKYLHLSTSIHQNIWRQDSGLIVNIDIQERDIFIKEKLEHGSNPLNEYAIIKFGIKVYQTGKGKPKQLPDAAMNKIFESREKLSDEYLPYLIGKNIDKYFFHWDGKYLKYGQHLAEPRNIELFKGSRLLVRRIVGKTLISTFIDQELLTGQLLQIVKPFDESISRTLLAILNSKLLAYYFRKKYNRQDITFPEIRIYELASLPIKVPKDKLPFNFLVDQILSQKKHDPSVDTTILESEIDQLVYELYCLTEEEIKIIEQSF